MSPLSEISSAQTVSTERLLLREMSHRVNNELSSAISILSVATRRCSSEDARIALQKAEARLLSFAQVNRLLQAPEHDDEIEASGYLQDLCRTIASSKLEAAGIELLFIEGKVRMEAGRCWRLGLLVSELITNCLRHAFREGAGGKIQVEVRTFGEWVQCRVSDNGTSESSVRFGYGLRVVDALATDLGGKLDQRFGSVGSTSAVTFPRKGNPMKPNIRPGAPFQEFSGLSQGVE